MCHVDFADDDTQFARSVSRKARKEHYCSECSRRIAIGESYEYTSGKCYSEMWSAKTCSHCQVCQQWLIKQCRGFLFHDVYDDIQDHLEIAPKRLYMPLARLIVGMRNRWQSSTGNLMKLPKLPATFEEYE